MADRKLALCLVDASNDFQQILKADAESAARRGGLGLDVYFTGQDLATQLNQLRACVEAGPSRADGIMVLAGSLLPKGDPRVGLRRDPERRPSGWSVRGSSWPP